MARPNRPHLGDVDLLRALVRTLPEAVYVTTRDGAIIDANPAFLALLGITSLDTLGEMGARGLMVDVTVRDRELALLDQSGTVRDYEMEILRPDGERRTVIDSSSPYRDPASGELLYIGVLIDITERKRLEARLIEQGRRDPLTGCFNRRYLAEVATRAEGSPTPWGCIAIDVDHFKVYNDTRGHQAGDDILVEMARFLTRNTRAVDSVIRMGGDEFLVLLNAADVETTRAIAARMETASDEAPVPFSLGWATREGDERIERTIARADQRMLAVRAGVRRLENRHHERRSQVR